MKGLFLPDLVSAHDSVGQYNGFINLHLHNSDTRENQSLDFAKYVIYILPEQSPDFFYHIEYKIPESSEFINIPFVLGSNIPQSSEPQPNWFNALNSALNSESKVIWEDYLKRAKDEQLSVKSINDVIKIAGELP